MTEERPTLHITLNPDGVAAPVHGMVAFITEAVGTAVRALESDDCSEQEAWGGPAMGYRFNGLKMSAEERCDAFKNWVLAKGFQDLARGVRESLEEALFYIKVFAIGSGFRTSKAGLEAKLAGIRAANAKLPFPALMEQVNAGLREPMAFEAEFRSLQNVRNCLEHRGGRVGPKDVDESTGKLVLTFPRLMVGYMRGEEEVEMLPGEAIDTWQEGHRLEEDTTLYMKRVTRSREYALNEPVAITQRDFYEIAMACFIFVSDLAQKLPSNAAEQDEQGAAEPTA